MKSENAVNITNYSWLVGTRKNLTLSNLFYLSVFQEGKGPSDSNSHYFYIEENRVQYIASSSSSALSSTSTSRDASNPTPPSSSASSNTSSVPTSAASVNVPTGSVTNAPNLSTQETLSDGFPLGAKIGLGVGIPVALILGLAAGWLLFRRHKNADAALPYVAQEVPANQTVQYKSYDSGNCYGANLNEAPLKSPVEMAQGFNRWGGEPQHKPATPPGAVPVRYEM